MSPNQRCVASPNMDVTAIAETAVGTAIFKSQRNRSTSTVYKAISTPNPMMEAMIPPVNPTNRPVRMAVRLLMGSDPVMAQNSRFFGDCQ